MTIKFTVYAKPEPQGSTRAFIPKGWKRPIITSANKELKSFRQQVSIVALAEMRALRLNPIPRKAPVRLEVKFYFQRPKSKSKKAFPVCKPDCDKLIRSIGDSLSGICFFDDSQITWIEAEKHYGEPERTEIEVSG